MEIQVGETHYISGRWDVMYRISDLKKDKHIYIYICIYIGLSPLPVRVTTRIITFLVGNPYKSSFPLLLGGGTTQYIYIYMCIYIYIYIYIHYIQCELFYFFWTHLTEWTATRWIFGRFLASYLWKLQVLGEVFSAHKGLISWVRTWQFALGFWVQKKVKHQAVHENQYRTWKSTPLKKDTPPWKHIYFPWKLLVGFGEMSFFFSMVPFQGWIPFIFRGVYILGLEVRSPALRELFDSHGSHVQADGYHFLGGFCKEICVCIYIYIYIYI